jgi:uncharacterized protein
MLVRTIVFYLLTFGFTVLLGGLQQEVLGAELPLSLAQWGPGLAGLLMLVVFRKDRLNISFALSDLSIRRVLLAFGLPFIPALVVMGVYLVVGLPADVRLQLPASLAVAAGILFGALGEEIGWRGYLHKMLDQRTRPLVSTLLVGILWGLWHVQLYQNGVLYMAAALVVFVSFSLVIYLLVRGARFNAWLASLFHMAINLSFLWFFTILNEAAFMWLYAAVWLPFAGLVWWFARRNQHTA